MIFRSLIVSCFLLGLPISPAFSLEEPENSKRRQVIKACKASRTVLKRIDLSETQKEDLDNAIESYLEETEDLRTNKRESGKAAVVEMFRHDDIYDEDTLMALVDAYAEDLKALTIEKAQLLHEAQSIMADDQYGQFVKSQKLLFVCTAAPRLFYNRVIKKFLDNN